MACVTALRRASTTTASFIARARDAKDPRALLGPFRSTGCFDEALEGMEITKIGPDGAEVSLEVTRKLANNFGTLHGGMTALLVDVVGTLALLGRDPSRPGISIEMNQTFTATAEVGEVIIARGTVLRCGRSLGFTEVSISTPDKLIATGRHTKFFG